MPLGIKPTRTGLLMDELLNIHRPSLWVFAHYHVRKTLNFKGTHFIALDVQQTHSMEFDDSEGVTPNAE